MSFRAKHWFFIFAAVIATLHWRGASRVPDTNLSKEKLCLSLPVLWRGNGQMFIMGLLRKKNLEKPEWKKLGGIWWLSAPSKYSGLLSISHFLNPLSIVVERISVLRLWEGVPPGSTAFGRSHGMHSRGLNVIFQKIKKCQQNIH